MHQLLRDLLSLFYPELCPSCSNLLSRDEKTICLSCRFLMPKTGYETVADNPVARMFWGRVRLNAVSACYFFVKKGRVQPLIHELKYKSNKKAGHFLGVEMAKQIIQSPLYEGVDFIVPVPLHPKKIKLRGYNQSEIIADGMTEVMKAPMNKDVLVREVATSSQTRKSREARWQNVKDIFVLKETELFEGKHILLIDDVITTGSTIEACANTLLKVKGIKVSVAAAACAPI
jgi:ComF family protein